FGATTSPRRALKERGFWDFVQSSLSPEGFAFVRDGLGYQSIIDTWNAAEHIPWFLAEFGAAYKGIVGGFGRLIEGLIGEITLQAEKVGLKPEQILLTRREVTSVLVEVDSRVRLTIGNPRESEFGEEANVVARNVILALPQGALANLSFDRGLSLNHELKDQG